MTTQHDTAARSAFTSLWASRPVCVGIHVDTFHGLQRLLLHKPSKPGQVAAHSFESGAAGSGFELGRQCLIHFELSEGGFHLWGSRMLDLRTLGRALRDYAPCLPRIGFVLDATVTPTTDTIAA